MRTRRADPNACGTGPLAARSHGLSAPGRVAAATLAVSLAFTGSLDAQVVPVDGTELAAAVAASDPDRCVIRPSGDDALALLLGEAQRVFATVTAEHADPALEMRGARYLRHLDADGVGLERELDYEEFDFTGPPVEGPSPDELVRNGFAERTASGWRLHWPGTELLTSDPFLDAYCFRLGLDDDQPGLAGVAFEPATEWSAPALEGILWFDLDTGILVRFEWRYLGLDAELEPDEPDEHLRHFRGGMEFQPIETGEWYVRDWWLQSPITQSRMVRDRWTPQLVGIMESGGEVFGVAELGALPPPRTAPAPGAAAAPGSDTLVVIVREAGGGAPLPGALGRIQELGLSAVSGPQGRLVFPSVPPGEHLLDVQLLGHTTARLPVSAPRAGPLEVGIAPAPIRLDEILVEVESVLGLDTRRRAVPATAEVIGPRRLAELRVPLREALLSEIDLELQPCPVIPPDGTIVDCVRLAGKWLAPRFCIDEKRIRYGQWEVDTYHSRHLNTVEVFTFMGADPPQIVVNAYTHEFVERALEEGRQLSWFLPCW